MASQDWEWSYVGALKKRRKLTPQMRALRQRRLSGLKMAKPEETRARLYRIATMMREKKWEGALSVAFLSAEWRISISRVEQLAAEAKRVVCSG